MLTCVCVCVLPRPQAQINGVLLQLDVAVAERDFSAAVSLLALAKDVLRVLDRDSDVLVREVSRARACADTLVRCAASGTVCERRAWR